jgi:hypothetical protein
MSTTNKNDFTSYKGRIQRRIEARRNEREIDRFLTRNVKSLRGRLAEMGWTPASTRSWIESLPEPTDVAKTEARAWSHEPPAGRALRVAPDKKARARPKSSSEPASD